MPGRTKLLTPGAATLAVLAIVLAPAALAHGGPARPPQIKARPTNLMIDTETTLRGKGFPANSTIQIRECGRTSWLVPEDPCNTANTIAVHTDGKGRFAASFKAELCPEGMPGKNITERTCYVGEPLAAEDTERLVGAAKLTVTYP